MVRMNSLLWLLLFSTSVFAGSSVPGYPEQSHWPYGPSYTAETWSDASQSLLLYGEGTVLCIADVSDPTDMTILGEVRTNELVAFIDILDNGQLAAVADRNKWISLIDISNPSSPTLLGRYEVEDGRLPYGVAFGPVGSDLLYAAIGPAGLWVLDISTPGNPTLTGSYIDPGTDFVFDVEVLGDYAFLADDNEGVTAIDVSNPSNPTFSADLPAVAGASHITIEGSRAYVSRRNLGVSLVDLDVSGTPAVMTLLGTVDPADTPEGFGVFYRAEVSGSGRVLIADSINGNGLHIVDVDTPATPVFLDTFPQPLFFLAAIDEVAFGSATPGFGVPQMRAIDVDLVGNPSAPEQVDELFTFSYARDVAIDGQSVIIGNDSAGVVVVDLEDPADPVTSAWVGLGNQSGRSAARIGDTLVVATFGRDLQLVDISDPQSPILLADYRLENGGTGFELLRIPGTTQVLVAAGIGGVKVVDIADPNAPTQAASWIPATGAVTRVAMDGSTVAAAGNNDFWVVNFSDFNNPLELATDTLAETIEDIDLDGTTIYLADGIDGLRVWSFVTGRGTSLSEIGSFSTLPTSANGVKVENDTAYVAADTFWGMFILDVSNPAMPTQIDVISTPGDASYVTANQDFVVLSDLDAGVRIWGKTPVGETPFFIDSFEP